MTTTDRPDPADEPTQPTRYEWDDWKELALSAGVPEALADLGRAVIRERINHNWEGTARRLASNWVLLDALSRAPQAGGRLCQVLMETDGLRLLWPESGQGELVQL